MNCGVPNWWRHRHLLFFLKSFLNLVHVLFSTVNKYLRPLILLHTPICLLSLKNCWRNLKLRNRKWNRNSLGPSPGRIEDVWRVVGLLSASYLMNLQSQTVFIGLRFRSITFFFFFWDKIFGYRTFQLKPSFLLLESRVLKCEFFFFPFFRL